MDSTLFYDDIIRGVPLLSWLKEVGEVAVAEFAFVTFWIAAAFPRFDADEGSASVAGRPDGGDGHLVTYGDEGLAILVVEGDAVHASCHLENGVAAEGLIRQGQQTIVRNLHVESVGVSEAAVAASTAPGGGSVGREETVEVVIEVEVGVVEARMCSNLEGHILFSLVLHGPLHSDNVAQQTVVNAHKEIKGIDITALVVSTANESEVTVFVCNLLENHVAQETVLIQGVGLAVDVCGVVPNLAYIGE